MKSFLFPYPSSFWHLPCFFADFPPLAFFFLFLYIFWDFFFTRVTGMWLQLFSDSDWCWDTEALPWFAWILKLLFPLRNRASNKDKIKELEQTSQVSFPNLLAFTVFFCWAPTPAMTPTTEGWKTKLLTYVGFQIRTQRSEINAARPSIQHSCNSASS